LNALKLDGIHRILVLNRNHIGDCLLTTPMLRAIKRRFPRAHLSVSVPESNLDLLVTNPHVDEIVVRPKISSWGSKFGFGCQIRDRKYDLIISLQEKSVFYAIATRYAQHGRKRKPVTIALDHWRTRYGYDYTVRSPEVEQHEVYKYLEIADLLGCPREKRPVLELEPTPVAREKVERFVNSKGIHADVRFIGVNPGGTKPEKRWQVERFAEVADRLHDELGLPIMIFGGPGDHGLASAIADGMRHRPLVTAGRASLGQAAALLERCSLFVTGDTGPMHMAVAQAVPVVALFGPTNPAKFGPFTTQSVVIRHDEGCTRCGRPCLHTIQAQEVVGAALRMYTAPPVHRLQPDRSPSS
jgi:heptosyltransferase II